jgi:hypothetical protein
MARLPRFDLVGIPQHIIQRGNDRQPCFDFDVADLRAHTQQQRAWGSSRFRAQIEALTQRGTTFRPRGRPRSTAGRTRANEAGPCFRLPPPLLRSLYCGLN